MTERPIVAVDGDSLAHRAYHGYAHQAGGAHAGFLRLLADLIAGTDLTIDGLVVAFDSVTSWRRDLHPAYKAQRPDKDPELVGFVADLPGLCAQVGLPTLQVAGHEADDGVASVAAACEYDGVPCVVLSSDRDAYAIVSPLTTLRRVRGGGNDQWVTPQTLTRKLGMPYERYTQYAALRGDSSDNLPGVRGIGPKKAAALLSEYPTAEAAAADPIGCRSVLGKELGQRLIDDLAADESLTRRNLTLMTPVRTLPVTLEHARNLPPQEQVAARCNTAEVPQAASRLAIAVGRVDAAQEALDV